MDPFNQLEPEEILIIYKLCNSTIIDMPQNIKYRFIALYSILVLLFILFDIFNTLHRIQ